MLPINPNIFREYDIRGLVDKEFDENFAYLLGRGHAAFIQKKLNASPVVCIGQDPRLSSARLIKSLAQGLVDSGAQVIHLGLITTPMSYFSTFYKKNVNGAIMVTGSHNPPEYNGFKISVGRSTIYGEQIKELQDIIVKEQFQSGKGSETHYDIFPDYIERYKKEFQKFKDVPIVLDCGNGSAGCVARRLYEAVGLKPHILFEEPDGTFPNHHPDPTLPENLETLIATVKKNNAFLGIGFDGDADRIVLVDNEGSMVDGDSLIALCSQFVLEKNPGATIIGDVKCSDNMYEQIKKWGGKPLMWKSGHSLIKSKIQQTKAPFGGELSGHIFFADRNYGYDDALYAGLRIIEALSRSNKTVKDVLKDMPPAYSTPEIRMATTEEKKHSIVEKIKKEFSKEKEGCSVNLLDGIRVQFKDQGWALVRASNTQPVLVLRCEANTKENLKRIQSQFESLILSEL